MRGYYVLMSKANFKQGIMWLVLIILISMVALSIYGAFVGAEAAERLFNSVPMQMFWFLLTIAFIASLILFPSLVKRPSLLLIHLGCVGILAGSIWASETGHEIQKRLLGESKIRRGMMMIDEGKMDNQVAVASQWTTVKLPFYIGLEDFRVEYYDSEGPGGRQVHDYISDISVVKDGRVVKKDTIEVNRPFHYGGYYFYQRPFEESGSGYMVFAVSSDNGLAAVFGGYGLLVAGLFWQCWLGSMIKARGEKTNNGN